MKLIVNFTNPVVTMADYKQPSTKEKLAAIVNGFDDFDSEMKIGTRVCMILL